MRNPANTRTCAGCGCKADKSTLIRVAVLKDGSFRVNSKDGRGAYLCVSRDCLDKAIKKRRLNYILRTSVPAEIFDELSDITGSDQN